MPVSKWILRGSCLLKSNPHEITSVAVDGQTLRRETPPSVVLHRRTETDVLHLNRFAVQRWLQAAMMHRYNAAKLNRTADMRHSQKLERLMNTVTRGDCIRGREQTAQTPSSPPSSSAMAGQHILPFTDSSFRCVTLENKLIHRFIWCDCIRSCCRETMKTILNGVIQHKRVHSLNNIY